MMQEFDIRLTGVTVTPKNIFLDNCVAPHYNPTSLLLETEKRLKIILPDSLKKIYRIHNGGLINNVCIPNKDGRGLQYEDIIFPFSGYNELNPLERLRTVQDSVSDYASKDDPEQAKAFPDGCENMVILARWYNKTLFLDYNDSKTARVGFANFGHDHWKIQAEFWDEFDGFFSSLRHYKE